MKKFLLAIILFIGVVSPHMDDSFMEMVSDNEEDGGIMSEGGSDEL